MCSAERTLTPAGQTILRGDGFFLMLQPRNLQKGTSVRAGLALANSEYVICQDADLEYDPKDIVRLLEFAEQRRAAAVFGSRLANRAEIAWNAFQFGRVALTILFRVLFGTRITDVATCYKLVRTEVLRSLSLRSPGFDLDFEIAARLRRLRYAIHELPIKYRPRTIEDGKKIRWRDGFSAAWVLFKTRVARKKSRARQMRSARPARRRSIGVTHMPSASRPSSSLVPHWMTSPQARMSLLLFVASLACQLFFSYVARPPAMTVTWRQHLGGEYFNIAQAIVDGRGFSDLFGEATGPTAWMPPLFPAILALLLAVTNSRVVVAAVVVTLIHLSITTVGVTVYSIARRHARAVPPAAVILFRSSGWRRSTYGS